MGQSPNSSVNDYFIWEGSDLVSRLDRDIGDVVRETYGLPDDIIVHANKPVFDEYSFNADLYVGYDPNEGSLVDGMKWIVGNGYDREKDNFDEITSLAAMQAGGGSVWSIPVGEATAITTASNHFMIW